MGAMTERPVAFASMQAGNGALVPVGSDPLLAPNVFTVGCTVVRQGVGAFKVILDLGLGNNEIAPEVSVLDAAGPGVAKVARIQLGVAASGKEFFVQIVQATDGAPVDATVGFVLVVHRMRAAIPGQ